MSSTALDHYLDLYGRQADAEGIEAMPFPVQVVLRVVTGHGVIQNGGFHYFYEGADWAEELAGAFDILGFPEAAKATLQSTEVFPKGTVNRTRWLDDQYEMRGEDFTHPVWEEANRTLFAIRWDELEAAIAKYMAAHPAAFPEVPPVKVREQ